MWNVFQNYLAEVVIKNDYLSMYADDHQTFSSDNSTDQAEEGLHNANKMTSWYEENLLKVNIKKYQSMVLGKRRWNGFRYWWRPDRTISKYEAVKREYRL